VIGKMPLPESPRRTRASGSDRARCEGAERSRARHGRRDRWRAAGEPPGRKSPLKERPPVGKKAMRSSALLHNFAQGVFAVGVRGRGSRGTGAKFCAGTEAARPSFCLKLFSVCASLFGGGRLVYSPPLPIQFSSMAIQNLWQAIQKLRMLIQYLRYPI